MRFFVLDENQAICRKAEVTMLEFATMLSTGTLMFSLCTALLFFSSRPKTEDQEDFDDLPTYQFATLSEEGIQMPSRHRGLG